MQCFPDRHTLTFPAAHGCKNAHMLKKITLATCLLANFAHSEVIEPKLSNPNFLKGQADGWFWYKDPKDVPPQSPLEIKRSEKPSPNITITTKKEDAKSVDKVSATTPFSVVWLRENMPKLQEAAIDNPTKENVSAYMYAQRLAMDKAQNYAEKVRDVVAADPFLDENNRVPIASFASSQFDRSVSRGKDDALKSIATKAGLWVFYDSKCTFCGPQVNQANEVAKKYGFSTKFISIDNHGLPGLLEAGQWIKDSGQAKLLNIKITPTTVLVSPPNNYFVVSQGLMAQDALADRLILAAQSNDMLPPDILAGVQKYQRGVLKTADMADGASSDPKVWIQKLKDRLQGRY